MIRKPKWARMRIGLLLSLTVAMGIACAEESPEPTPPRIEIFDPVSHPSLGVPVGVVYLRVVNHDEQSERLVSVSSSVSKAAELHESIADGNMMRMVHHPNGFEIAPGQELTLGVGGKHIMLTGLSQELKDGSSFDLELNFENAGLVKIVVPVRPRAY